MLEKETERIVGVIAQRSIGAAPSVALKDILASDIPQTVKTFFRSDVEAMLHGGTRRGQTEPVHL